MKQNNNRHDVLFTTLPAPVSHMSYIHERKRVYRRSQDIKWVSENVQKQDGMRAWKGKGKGEGKQIRIGLACIVWCNFGPNGRLLANAMNPWIA